MAQKGSHAHVLRFSTSCPLKIVKRSPAAFLRDLFLISPFPSRAPTAVPPPHISPCSDPEHRISFFTTDRARIIVLCHSLMIGGGREDSGSARSARQTSAALDVTGRYTTGTWSHPYLYKGGTWLAEQSTPQGSLFAPTATREVEFLPVRSTAPPAESTTRSNTMGSGGGIPGGAVALFVVRARGTDVDDERATDVSFGITKLRTVLRKQKERRRVPAVRVMKRG